ncbi:MAG: phosphotransacetylase family protein, partial [Chitinophagaceae bacterium]
MNNAIYITTSQAYSGKSIITLGLMNILMGKTKKVAYFKPIINEHPSIKVDNHIAMIKTHFGLVTNDADMFAFTKEEVLKLRADGNTAYIIDTIIQKYKKLEETNDFVIVEGTDFLTEGVSFEFDANVAIAKNLGTPVILVVNGEQLNNEEIVTTTLSNLKSFNDRDVPVIAVVANKVAAETALLLKNKLQNELPKTIISSVIPVNKDLGNPTMKEIAENIEAKILFGEKRLSNQVDKYIVGAMQLRNLLTRLENNTLIVTPGDRGDIILAALQADASKNYPKVAGLILTGGLEPEDSIKQLIDGLEGVVPILQVESGTFETVTMVAATPSRIYADNKRKIALALNTFEQFIDVQQIENQIRSFQ